MTIDHDEEIAALVVDNGSGMCKAGFAGDDAPGNLVSWSEWSNVMLMWEMKLKRSEVF
jgi:actin-related protein